METWFGRFPNMWNNNREQTQHETSFLQHYRCFDLKGQNDDVVPGSDRVSAV